MRAFGASAAATLVTARQQPELAGFRSTGFCRLHRIPHTLRGSGIRVTNGPDSFNAARANCSAIMRRRSIGWVKSLTSLMTGMDLEDP